jgi:hypothetical protein
MLNALRYYTEKEQLELVRQNGLSLARFMDIATKRVREEAIKNDFTAIAIIPAPTKREIGLALKSGIILTLFYLNEKNIKLTTNQFKFCVKKLKSSVSFPDMSKHLDYTRRRWFIKHYYDYFNKLPAPTLREECYVIKYKDAYVELIKFCGFKFSKKAKIFYERQINGKRKNLKRMVRSLLRNRSN